MTEELYAVGHAGTPGFIFRLLPAAGGMGFPQVLHIPPATRGSLLFYVHMNPHRLTSRELRRIQEIVDFFYSSDSSNDVPFRIALTAGMSGTDISKEQLGILLAFLFSSCPINRTTCQLFLDGADIEL